MPLINWTPAIGMFFLPQDHKIETSLSASRARTKSTSISLKAWQSRFTRLKHRTRIEYWRGKNLWIESPRFFWLDEVVLPSDPPFHKVKKLWGIWQATIFDGCPLTYLQYSTVRITVHSVWASAFLFNWVVRHPFQAFTHRLRKVVDGGAKPAACVVGQKLGEEFSPSVFSPSF